MSLNTKSKLAPIAKQLCRELRKNQTNAEAILWERLRNRKLSGYKFNRQFAIFHDLTGRETFYIADFYCNEKRLVIEVDGEIHKKRFYYDEERTNILTQLGKSGV
ncbi:MAG: endonuclease domain-containing protein [Melioribacteraceae bacterium]|nr:endonuclease domain-containing protein [Melioribacteraceae bacterium]MCF8356432.1 endonuclease domain-containing protein [Melioribacteraceae bacterium]MCF8394875.1 endonuclease domain-containing protein [Melioribacteraceae bacterium]